MKSERRVFKYFKFQFQFRSGSKHRGGHRGASLSTPHYLRSGDWLLRPRASPEHRHVPTSVELVGAQPLLGLGGDDRGHNLLALRTAQRADHRHRAHAARWRGRGAPNLARGGGCAFWRQSGAGALSPWRRLMFEGGAQSRRVRVGADRGIGQGGELEKQLRSCAKLLRRRA